MFSFSLLMLPSVLSPCLVTPIPNSLWHLYFSAWNTVAPNELLSLDLFCCLHAILRTPYVFGVVSPRMFAPMCLLASPCQHVTNQEYSIFVKFSSGRFHWNLLTQSSFGFQSTRRTDTFLWRHTFSTLVRTSWRGCQIIIRAKSVRDEKVIEKN